MEHVFHHWRSGTKIHVEEIPDDCPRPTRVALEQAGMRGRSHDQLRVLRRRTVETIAHLSRCAVVSTDSPNDGEVLRRRVDAIDRELDRPRAMALLTALGWTDPGAPGGSL